MPENFVVGPCRHSLTPDEARELYDRLGEWLKRQTTTDPKGPQTGAPSP